MAKIRQIFLLIFCLLLFSCQKEKKLKLGAERIESYLSLLKKKKVAVVGNQTSMIGSTHLVDSLLNLKIDIVKVFSPEHGFRGKEDAGAKIKNGIDSKSGLPIISLYGKNRKLLAAFKKEKSSSCRKSNFNDWLYSFGR